MYGLYDPDLTSAGIHQCEELCEEIEKLKPDLIFTSPLIRAFNTSLISTKKLFQNRENKDLLKFSIIATNLLRESFNSTSDIGSEKNKLEETKNFYLEEYENTKNKELVISNIDDERKEKEENKKEIILNETNSINNTINNKVELKFIVKKFWWNYLEDKEENRNIIVKETSKEIFIRIILLLLWSFLREENKLIFVSHSKIFPYFTCHNNKEKAKHGKLIKLDSNFLINKLIEYLLEIQEGVE